MLPMRLPSPSPCEYAPSGSTLNLQVAALYEKTLKAATPTEAKHLEAGKAKEASWEAKHHHVPAPAP